VLMPWEAEPARRAQRGGAGLAGGGQIPGRPPLGPLALPLRSGLGPLAFPLFGDELRSSGAALLAQPAPFLGGGDEDGGVQLLAVAAHRNSPRFSATSSIASGRNHD